jgi:hypothetical protein
MFTMFYFFFVMDFPFMSVVNVNFYLLFLEAIALMLYLFVLSMMSALHFSNVALVFFVFVSASSFFLKMAASFFLFVDTAFLCFSAMPAFLLF